MFQRIYLCIISSKDFDFIYNKAMCANIFSCILGIETLVLDGGKKDVFQTNSKEDLSSDKIPECQDFSIKNNHLLVGINTLQHNSEILSH
jgi:hypothetical protein